MHDKLDNGLESNPLTGPAQSLITSIKPTTHLFFMRITQISPLGCLLISLGGHFGCGSQANIPYNRVGLHWRTTKLILLIVLWSSLYKVVNVRFHVHMSTKKHRAAPRPGLNAGGEIRTLVLLRDQTLNLAHLTRLQRTFLFERKGVSATPALH